MGTHAHQPRLSARVIALLLALGLGALLIGLSAAHTALPGDTFQVTPRVAAGAAMSVTLPGDPESDPPGGGLLAILPVALVLAAGGLLFVRFRSAPVVPATRSVPAAGCRGPPLA